MNLTLELLRILGSPFSSKEVVSVKRFEIRELCQYSIKNKMLLYFLDKIGKNNQKELANLYQEEYNKYNKTRDAIVRISRILSNRNIDHVFFKTIRPYKSSPVDIDVLIFGDKNNYIKAINEMQRAGNKLVAYGPRSTTLFDQKSGIRIDLYEHVATSFLIYVDKQTLFPNLTVTRLDNGNYVNTLKCEADLLCLIAHSIVKEQMYTLSEYYTFIHYLKQLNVRYFLKIAKQNNLTTAVKTHASITALLHKAAHGSVPTVLQEILTELGEDRFETALIVRKNFKTPHKYHLLTVVRVLLEIVKGEKTRDSIAYQILKMTNLSFTKRFIKDVIKHLSRETY